MENANWKINAFAKKSRKALTLTADCANSMLVDDYLLKTTFHKSYTSFIFFLNRKASHRMCPPICEERN